MHDRSAEGIQIELARSRAFEQNCRSDEQHDLPVRQLFADDRHGLSESAETLAVQIAAKDEPSLAPLATKFGSVRVKALHDAYERRQGELLERLLIGPCVGRLMRDLDQRGAQSLIVWLVEPSP